MNGIRLVLRNNRVIIWKRIGGDARIHLIFVENVALNARRYIEKIIQETVIQTGLLIGQFLNEIGIPRLE